MDELNRTEAEEVATTSSPDTPANKAQIPTMGVGVKYEQLSFMPTLIEKEKKKSKTKTIFTILFVLLNIGVILFAAIRDFADNTDPIAYKEVFKMFGQNWYYLVFAFMCLLLTFVFDGTKMNIMLFSLTRKSRFALCTETAILIKYYDNVTPFAFGGQPFAIYHLNNRGVKVGEAATLPIASLFLTQLSFILLVALAIICASNDIIGTGADLIWAKPYVRVLAYIGLFAAMVLPVSVVLFSVLPKFSSWLLKIFIAFGAKIKLIKKPKVTTYKAIKELKNYINSLKIIGNNPLTLFLAFFCSIGYHLSLCSIAFFTLRAFGFDLPAGGVFEWLQAVQMCLILYSVVSIAPTPGNSGAAEVGFYMLFSDYAILGGLGAGFSFSAMLTWRIISYYILIAIGIFTLFRIKIRGSKKHTEIKEETK